MERRGRNWRSYSTGGNGSANLDGVGIPITATGDGRGVEPRVEPRVASVHSGADKVWRRGDWIRFDPANLFLKKLERWLRQISPIGGTDARL